MGTIGDRGADLRRTISLRGIEPVKPFAARDIRLQIGTIMDGGPSGLGIQMIEAVAPVRERQIVVDAHKIDGGAGPERIEMEIDIAAAILRLMPEIFRPIGGIAEPAALHLWSPRLSQSLSQTGLATGGNVNCREDKEWRG